MTNFLFNFFFVKRCTFINHEHTQTQLQSLYPAIADYIAKTIKRKKIHNGTDLFLFER